MMAFERTPGGSALDPEVIAELRRALSRSVKTGNHGDELKSLLTRAAADARSRGILAEQLLLALKDVWYSLPELSSSPGNDIQTRLLQQLIARWIQEYNAT